GVAQGVLGMRLSRWSNMRSYGISAKGFRTTLGHWLTLMQARFRHEILEMIEFQVKQNLGMI
ncbi:hypothetical protein L195_g039698, partial [Trifolium pratense]